MSLRGAGGVVKSECLALQKHAVVVDKHRTVNEFEGALTVILEIANSVKSVGVVALRLDFEAQLHGLALDNLVAVGHHIDSKGIGLCTSRSSEQEVRLHMAAITRESMAIKPNDFLLRIFIFVSVGKVGAY